MTFLRKSVTGKRHQRGLKRDFPFKVIFDLPHQEPIPIPRDRS